ncbi:MAG: N-acetylglutaminylglutamine amidotransferase [Bdellovibrionales bacterium]|nr:N-acetylglutaminylglutamine amidotransferase [Bdellovibrionales bacterium]
MRFDSKRVDIEGLSQACEVMRPRGPDDNGQITDGHWGFGHTRLSIIDLSESGHQPMSFPELNLTITYNGEIYNYREIREELEHLGHRFETKSDTEVILRGFKQWRESLIPRLYGMFAFAIYDSIQNKMFFCRDRLGIKPLYYSITKKKINFASNIKALLKFKEIDTSLDPIALHNYMTLHSIVFEPNTILNGVKKVPAAHYGWIDGNNEIRFERYWTPRYCQPSLVDSKKAEIDWLDELDNIIERAVQRRLVADVPVGLFLSGGVDSSLIAHYIAKNQSNLMTFSIGFEGAENEEGDEFRYSDLVSKELSTNHHKIRINRFEILEHLTDCIGQMNEPMVSYDNIGFYMLSKFASEHVKVVQSGQGADEVFGGYHWHGDLRDSKSPIEDYKRLFFDRTHSRLKNEMSPEWTTRDYTSALVDSFLFECRPDNPIEMALQIDTHRMLVEDPVKRVDSNTMAWGLEARVPFLDHELIEFAAMMPTNIKVGMDLKASLKKVASR